MAPAGELDLPVEILVGPLCRESSRAADARTVRPAKACPFLSIGGSSIGGSVGEKETQPEYVANVEKSKTHSIVPV